MPSTAVQKSKDSLSLYPVLLKRVRDTLLLGQRQIEQAKVQTYWQTGKLIHEHLLHFKDRAEFGKQVIKKLAEDLEVGRDLVYRALKFYQAFPIVATSRQLTWSHYVELSKVPDEKTRFQLTARAEKSEWSAKQLAGKVQLETGRVFKNGNGVKGGGQKGPEKLNPKLGELYTYRLVRPLDAHGLGDSVLQIDLGFSTHRFMPVKEKGFKEGRIVETRRDGEGNYSVKPSKRGKADLWTYKAVIERVVDGDTLIVRVDLGFEIEERHYLRLRDINTPELDTKEGKRAKAFVEKAIQGAPFILLHTTRDDKYGRYVADVFIPSKSVIESKGENLKKDGLLFLNQELLNQGLAVKAG